MDLNERDHFLARVELEDSMRFPLKRAQTVGQLGKDKMYSPSNKSTTSTNPNGTLHKRNFDIKVVIVIPRSESLAAMKQLV